MPNSDAANIAQWRKHRDERAFQQIIERYSGLVFGTGRRITGNSEDAEEITQNCFLKLAENPPVIEQSLGGWLHRAATNLAIDEIRKDERRKLREKQYQALRSDKNEATSGELQSVIDEAIDQLPDRVREPLISHYFGGLTYVVIAKRTGISRQTISSRVSRGVAKIRTILSRKGYIAGGATVAATLQTLAAETVPPVLAQSLTELPLSNVTISPVNPLATLFTGSVFRFKPIAWMTLVAVVVGAFAWFMWSSRPVEDLGLAKSTAAAPSAQRKVISVTDPEIEGKTVAAHIDDDSPSSDTTQAAEAQEAQPGALVLGTVVHKLSGQPIPNVSILIYPQEAIDFSIEERNDLPALHDQDIVRTIRENRTLGPEDHETPSFVLSYSATFSANPSAGIGFVTDEHGSFNAESLLPGKYMAIIRSEEYSAIGQAAFDFDDERTALIDGFAPIEVYEQGEFQSFSIQADTRTTIYGKIFDQATNMGIAQIPVRAYRRTSSSFLAIEAGSTITNGEGAYEFRSLPIGQYVVVRDEVNSFHGERSRRLSVRSTSENRADFPLGKGTVIVGTVYWGDVPAANIDFLLHYSDGTVAMGAKVIDSPVHTDENGQYIAAGLKNFDGILFGSVRLDNNDSLTSDWVQNLSLKEGDFKTVDLHFDIGTATIEGRFTRAGEPIRKAVLMWNSGDVHGMQQRTSTGNDGYYRLEGIPSGPSTLSFFYPGTYVGVNRTVQVNEGELLLYDVDVPEGSVTISIENLPREMRNTWVYVFDSDYRMPTSSSQKDWITQRRFEHTALTRVFPNTPAELNGLAPGSYKVVVNASRHFGYYSHFVDDPNLLRKYFDETALLFMDLEVSPDTVELGEVFRVVWPNDAKTMLEEGKFATKLLETLRSTLNQMRTAFREVGLPEEIIPKFKPSADDVAMGAVRLRLNAKHCAKKQADEVSSLELELRDSDAAISVEDEFGPTFKRLDEHMKSSGGDDNTPSP